MIGKSETRTWVELARAQIHGYDCIDAKFLSDLRFASISDEKVARVFDAPGVFVSLLNTLEIRSDKEDTAVMVASNTAILY